MTTKIKRLLATSVIIAAVASSARAQFVGYQDVPQSLPNYSGIAPSHSVPSVSPSYGYGNGYAPIPLAQKQVKQVTMYKVENNGTLTKCLGKVEISRSGATVVAVRDNGTWRGTCGIVYAIDERDPMYQYFDYHARIASGQLYLF